MSDQKDEDDEEELFLRIKALKSTPRTGHLKQKVQNCDDDGEDDELALRDLALKSLRTPKRRSVSEVTVEEQQTVCKRQPSSYNERPQNIEDEQKTCLQSVMFEQKLPQVVSETKEKPCIADVPIGEEKENNCSLPVQKHIKESDVLVLREKALKSLLHKKVAKTEELIKKKASYVQQKTVSLASLSNTPRTNSLLINTGDKQAELTQSVKNYNKKVPKRLSSNSDGNGRFGFGKPSETFVKSDLDITTEKECQLDVFTGDASIDNKIDDDEDKISLCASDHDENELMNESKESVKLNIVAVSSDASNVYSELNTVTSSSDVRDIDSELNTVTTSSDVCDIDSELNNESESTNVSDSQSEIKTVTATSVVNDVHLKPDDVQCNSVSSISDSVSSISDFSKPNSTDLRQYATPGSTKNQSESDNTALSIDFSNAVSDDKITSISNIELEDESTKFDFKEMVLECEPGPSGYNKPYSDDSDASIIEVPQQKEEALVIDLLSDDEVITNNGRGKQKVWKCRGVMESLRIHTNIDGNGIREDLKDLTCSICLGPFENRSFLNKCFHSFCYICITQWSELSRLCPLCKTKYNSSIHSVTKDLEYEQYVFSTDDTQPQEIHREFNENMQDGRRFRYRSTITNHEVWAARRQERERLERERSKSRQQRKMDRRLKWSATKDRRKSVYKMKMCIKEVEQKGRPKQRDISPKFFQDNPALKHRLVPWLLRDLNVLLGDDDENIHFVMSLILNLISKISLDEEEFQNQLRPFLFNETDHFLTEFISFAMSPYDIKGYDDNVVYDIPEKKTEIIVITSEPTNDPVKSKLLHDVFLGEEQSHPMQLSRWERSLSEQADLSESNNVDDLSKMASLHVPSVTKSTPLSNERDHTADSSSEDEKENVKKRKKKKHRSKKKRSHENCQLENEEELVSRKKKRKHLSVKRRKNKKHDTTKKDSFETTDDGSDNDERMAKHRKHNVNSEEPMTKHRKHEVSSEESTRKHRKHIVNSGESMTKHRKYNEINDNSDEDIKERSKKRKHDKKRKHKKTKKRKKNRSSDEGVSAGEGNDEIRKRLDKLKQRYNEHAETTSIVAHTVTTSTASHTKTVEVNKHIDADKSDSDSDHNNVAKKKRFHKERYKTEKSNPRKKRKKRKNENEENFRKYKKKRKHKKKKEVDSSCDGEEKNDENSGRKAENVIKDENVDEKDVLNTDEFMGHLERSKKLGLMGNDQEYKSRTEIIQELLLVEKAINRRKVRKLKKLQQPTQAVADSTVPNLLDQDSEMVVLQKKDNKKKKKAYKDLINELQEIELRINSCRSSLQVKPDQI